MNIEYVNKKLMTLYRKENSYNSEEDSKIVYRICRKTEIKKILKLTDFSKIGNSFSKNICCNTHNYDENELYMHFFKKKDDIFRLYNIISNYLCSYSIPNKILEKSKGIGMYQSEI